MILLLVVICFGGVMKLFTFKKISKLEGLGPLNTEETGKGIIIK